MKSILLLINTLFSIVCISQDFQLIMPKPIELKSQLENTNFNDDVIQLYLSKNYKESSKKIKIKKHDFPDFEVCQYTQIFDKNISFSINKCDEDGGISKTLVIPITNIHTITKWIELIHECISEEFPNVWNKEHTTFRPEDEGVGCYYEIKETKKETIIQIHCGC